MTEREAKEALGDCSELPAVDADGNEKRRKKRVIPYRGGPPQHPGASPWPRRCRADRRSR